MFDSVKFRAWLLSPAKNRYFELDTYKQSVVKGNLSFSATDTNGKFSIYLFNNLQPDMNDDRFIRNKYPIEIDFSTDSIPKVKVSEDIIAKIPGPTGSYAELAKKTRLHFFRNNTCCLCEEAESMYKLKNGEITEENFIEQVVIPFFYRFGCAEHEMTPPNWGERSHDFRGLLESYSESGAKWDEAIFLHFVGNLKYLLCTNENENNNIHLWNYVSKSTTKLKSVKKFSDFYSGSKKRKRILSDTDKKALTHIRARYQAP